MALVLIKEDGTGKTDANSYADVSDADAYHEGHLYAAAWTGASTADKEKALVMATRLIDSQVQFNGVRTNAEQALQWPRERCPDPDKGVVAVWALGPGVDRFVPYDQVPKAVVDATCEMGRELLIADRTAAPPGEGILSEHTSQYSRDAVGVSSSTSSTTMYSKRDTRPIISHVAQAMLWKFGVLVRSGAGSVALVRT